MPIFSRFDVETVSSVQVINTDTLSKMFKEIIEIGAVINRKQFHREYLPKYNTKTFTISGRKFSVRPAWTDYKPDPRHIIVIGHILLCHLFEGESITHQPSARLFGDSIEYRLEQFQQLLSNVNANKYPTPTVAPRKVTA